MAKHPANNNKIKPEIKINDSFAQYIKRELKPVIKKLPLNFEKTEPLAYIDYKDEIAIKNRALAKFLADSKITVKPESIIPSPLSRKYRTTSKRKVTEKKGQFYFLFADEDYPTRPDLFRPSMLEPDQHKTIYEYLCGMFNSAGYIFLARAMNFIIIRGSYSEFSVIFNISKINADIIKKLKLVSEKLQSLNLNIISSFAYYDPTKSEYYFEAERPDKEVSFKKFFGPDYLFLKVNDKKFSYHPTSFSQINESIIPLLIKRAEDILKPDKSESFYDLYCGYGLFACSFAGLYKETTGIEAAGESVKSASLNAKYIAKESRIRFTAKRIPAPSLEESLPSQIKGKEVFLLDPPRSGTANGVIDVIAARNPVKAVHIFCGVDEIPQGVEEWKNNGYELKLLAPLDLFPGSPNLEVIALFTR